MLPVFKGPTHAYVGASPACWRLYGHASTLSWSRPEGLRLERLVVDAYGAQHPGRRQVRAVQSVAVHLMGLCTVLERGAEPRIAPTRGRKRVRRTLDLHWLAPPSPIGTLTVNGPLRARGPEEHAAGVEAWARDVWAAWAPHHETVRSWLDVASRGPDAPRARVRDSGVKCEGVVMTQACCPSCRLRFSRACAAHIETCPHCARPLQRIDSARDALGYRLFVVCDPSPAVPAAVAVALPVPGAPQKRP